MAGDPVDDAAVLNALFADSPQGLFVFDAERKVTRYSPAGQGVRERSAEGGAEGFAPGFEPDGLRDLIDETLASGEPLRNRLVRGRSPSDPHRTLTFDVSLFPLHGRDDCVPGVVGVVEDVTERQAAADRLAVLSTVHAAVGSTLDAETTADELVRSLVPAFADAASVDLVDDDPATAERQAGPLSVSVPLRRVAFASSEVEAIRKKGDNRPFPFPTPYTQALGDTHARLVRVSADEAWLSADPDGFAHLIEANVHSMIAAPLVARGTVLGLLSLYRNRANPFDEADLDVARQAATTASAHLDNARSYRREHTVASTLQRRLQPGVIPHISAVETAHVYLPEGAGGGWFDVIPLSGTRVALVVGAVAGRGIEAAATMGQLRVALRTLALQDLETDELLIHLDEVAAQLSVAEAGRFPAAGADSAGAHVATCTISVYDPVSRQCTMICAGHPAPVVIDPDGSPLPVNVPQGPPLGTGKGTFTPFVVQLPAGSLIAHCSPSVLSADDDDGDGDGDGEAVGRRHLEHALAPTTRPLQELCDSAVYSAAPSRHDDAVLLLARTHALSPEQVADWTLPPDASVVGTARRLVVQQLSAWRLADVAFTTEIIVSELVTNAIRYGKGPIRLRLIHDQGRLLSEVTDSHSASPHLRHARASDEGGRGLYIVMRLSSRWGVRHSRRDKTIWSEQHLGEAPPDSPAALDVLGMADADADPVGA